MSTPTSEVIVAAVRAELDDIEESMSRLERHGRPTGPDIDPVFEVYTEHIQRIVAAALRVILDPSQGERPNDPRRRVYLAIRSVLFGDRPLLLVDEAADKHGWLRSVPFDPRDAGEVVVFGPRFLDDVIRSTSSENDKPPL